MAKSVSATLVAAAVLDGMLSIDDPAAASEWAADDPRAAITWNDLLRMQSGLAFEEVYEDPSSDVSRMLFRAREAGAVAAKAPLVHTPGTHWSYSSGTTNLLIGLLAKKLRAQDLELQSFARNALFAPLGAPSFILEVDSAGYPVSSSFIYATARDWGAAGPALPAGRRLEWNEIAAGELV